MNERILDVTCGSRSIWFQKDEPHTIYCDIRDEEWTGDFGNKITKSGKKSHREIKVHPDMICDFTDIPFKDNSFNLVVYDPPHVKNLSETSWTRKAYGTLTENWQNMLKGGFDECMRVLKCGGVLVFKWSDISISIREIINIFGQEPLFGHRSGKKANTHWMCFMKFETDNHDRKDGEDKE